MKPAILDASARQHSGGPSPIPGRGGNRNDRARKLGLSDVEAEIAGLFDRSIQELRLAWRKLHRIEPPFGISRDLLIRALAHQLQEQSCGGTGRALRRRLQTLTGERERRGASFDPAVVLKTGTTLVRQWRGHTHAVLCHEPRFGALLFEQRVGYHCRCVVIPLDETDIDVVIAAIRSNSLISGSTSQER
jgi:DUF2924 family protein